MSTAGSQVLNNKLKLLRHMDKLYEWVKTGFTYPVTVGINLTNLCNHKCPACICDYYVSDNKSEVSTVPFETLVNLVDELSKLGVKAISIGGGGDPTCYPKLGEAIEYIKGKGLEVSLTTNGTNLSDEDIKTIVRCCTWLRVSLDADCPEMYLLTHGVGEKAFNRTIENIRRATSLKRATNSEIVISTCYLIGPHTIEGIYNCTALCKELGVDHIRIRPFFTFGNKKMFSEEDSGAIYKELERSKELEGNGFIVSYPAERCASVINNCASITKKCNFHHFNALIAADLKMYICCHHMGVEKYCIGDMHDSTFAAIWASERRRNVFENINYLECPTPCDYAPSNELLWNIQQPIPHENFL